MHVSKLLDKNAKNVIVSCIYRPPRGDSHKFLNEIKTVICKNHEKPLFLVRDLNINSLDYWINPNVRDFFNFSRKQAYKSNKNKCNNN